MVRDEELSSMMRDALNGRVLYKGQCHIARGNGVVWMETTHSSSSSLSSGRDTSSSSSSCSALRLRVLVDMFMKRLIEFVPIEMGTKCRMRGRYRVNACRDDRDAKESDVMRRKGEGWWLHQRDVMTPLLQGTASKLFGLWGS